MLGSQCIKSWSKTQAVIAKSSAEGELYGIVRASREGLGLQPLGQDFGWELKVQLHMGGEAAAGIIERQGVSKVRQLDTDGLWIQEIQAKRIFLFGK